MENQSCAKIAEKLDSANKQELFRRMVFNALFGNTDDHLKNHVLLYDKARKSWNLSPAYDINPTPYRYEAQHHALFFIDAISLPRVALFREIAALFGVDDALFLATLESCVNAGEK